MFKIKGSRKGLSNEQEQRAVGSEKRLQLASNDDLINREEVHGMRYTQHQGSTGIVRSNSRMVRKRSVRDASGIVPTLTNSISSVPNSNSNGTILNDNSKVTSNPIKTVNPNPRQLASDSTITPTPSSTIPSNPRMLTLPRPLTSNIPNRPLNNKSRLLNRKGTGMVKRQHSQVDKDNEENREEYISNEQMEQMIEEVVLKSGQCQQLRNRSEELYGQVKEKILGNSGILVLKWYKIIQDRLYNQVVLAMNAGQGHTNNNNNSNNNNNNTNNNRSNNNNTSPSTISELITTQLSRHLDKQRGLLSIQEKCCSQQQKLSSLINQRLSKLQSYLKPQTVQ